MEEEYEEVLNILTGVCEGQIYWLSTETLNQTIKATKTVCDYNKKELLCAFFKFFRDNGEANIGMTIEQFVEEFLKIK